jgi:hypothetical protein
MIKRRQGNGIFEPGTHAPTWLSPVLRFITSLYFFEKLFIDFEPISKRFPAIQRGIFDSSVKLKADRKFQPQDYSLQTIFQSVPDYQY